MKSGIGPAGRIGKAAIDSKLTPLLVIAALALGVLAVVLTPREEEPQIILPVFDVFVGMPGATPAEVEERITIPLEKRMWEIPGVEYVYSTSMPDGAMVTVRFFVGEDIESSLVLLYDKIASGLDLIPDGATIPIIKTRTIDDVPVLGLTLWSDDADHYALRQMALELRRELSSLDDVSRIDVIGGQRRALSVKLAPSRLAAYGVDPGRIAESLAMQNVTMPAGSYESAGDEILVEANAFLTSVADVENLVVGLSRGRPVYLRDVAEVSDGPDEVDDYVLFLPGPAASAKGISEAREDRGIAPAVTLAIAKRKGSDAHAVVERLLDKVEFLKGRLIPPSVEVTVTRDYGETSNEKAGELLTHLIGAIVSVTIVVALFLGWRGGIVVFVSVPVTFALTLFVYYLFDYTLNRVTLFALIFVTGIVVDDSIIVVENMVRHFAMKSRSAFDAAVEAVSEVGNPTILATLTVIAAVLPMAFVRGLMGPYMRPMPVGASLAMLFSLGIALIVAPWLGYRLLRGGHEHHADAEGADIESTRVYRVYSKLMCPLLVSGWKRWAFLGSVFALLLAAVALVPLGAVTVKMLPFDNKSEVQIIIDTPEGTTLEGTTRVAREIAGYLGTVPEVTDLQIYAGTAAPVNFNGLVRHYDLRSGANVADVQVNLVHKSERDVKSHGFAKRIRGPIQEIAARHGAAVKVTEVPPGPPVLSTLVAEVYGPTADARLEAAEEILEIFRTTDGVVDVDWFVQAPQQKKRFVVDREKAALHGVPAASVARTLRLALAGEDVGRLHETRSLEPVPITLRLPRAERSSTEALSEIRVASLGGSLVPLSELVRVETSTREMTRHRKNLQPLIYVVGEVAGTQESPVYAILDMAERIDALELPSGASVEQHYRNEPTQTETVSMKWDGEWHITYVVFRDLGAAFGAVLILIYMLIIGWFKSFKVPLVMMIAIPLSLVGILPGHWVFGIFFTATSMIGFIALAGIMVRNSVLLIDFVEVSLGQGRSFRDAIVAAGAVRFRPILLTAGTVVVGAFVILFDPIFEGLAISLMFGAIASTVLTLVVVPLVHYMVERRRVERTSGDAEA